MPNAIFLRYASQILNHLLVKPKSAVKIFLIFLYKYMENNDELMPREKLLAFGAKALSDYELLAIFFTYWYQRLSCYVTF